ncbi:unnamed protein product [Thlaspi arvense]|uniref:Uncharacterized protein n=1 Tax=Thlaspi arvense TaxID=13288 RepID=A0AAU9S0Q0_THLAR|nr:unnamed protein product [Thlaspi arvense]
MLKVQSFKIVSRPSQVPGALHFGERNTTITSYGVQTNSSSKKKCGRVKDPTFKFLVLLQIAAEREIAKSLIGGTILDYLGAIGVVAFDSMLFNINFRSSSIFPRTSSFVLVFLLFLLFQLNMIGLAFMLSSFISKSSSATTVGFLVFLIGFMAHDWFHDTCSSNFVDFLLV